MRGYCTKHYKAVARSLAPGNLAGEMTHLGEPVLFRRLHEDNETPRHWRRLETA
ncbi:hypothetical protein LJ751_00990 [Arthrobacter sp. zg-Y809]|uniref:Uncharacterized protein n=1 Tax=Arthrobacter gengyunqii TaxID=2886940 RepID=A0A9X1LYA9_9MICC|nr:hypothetical protein [Arthrobacter gengyunqii]MCC3267938.1 hypothetical protein [Arthrobacter gengyunqii]